MRRHVLIYMCLVVQISWINKVVYLGCYSITFRQSIVKCNQFLFNKWLNCFQGLVNPTPLLFSFSDSFWTNPQYQLKVLQGNASKRSMYSCNVLVCLMQKHNSKHRNRMPHLHIGLSIFKVGGIFFIKFKSLKAEVRSSAALSWKWEYWTHFIES